MIPLSIPNICGNAWHYVKECIDTAWVSSAGKYVELFEQRICRFTGSAYAVACINGTAALQLALKISGVKPDDEVIVPTMTFIATPNAVHYLGAHPVFMDSDTYYNIDIDKTIRFIKAHTRVRNGFAYNLFTGRRVSAVLPVHVSGNAADLEMLVDVCQNRNITIIEDACESLGTRYTQGRLAGRHTGTIGAVGCLSFNGNKIITAGGGGMILTQEGETADKAKYLTTQAKDDPFRYVHHEVGYNFRLTNIQAALGVSQLEQLSGFLEKKKRVYRSYKERIDPIPGVKVTELPPYADNNHWMISIQIDEADFGMNRESLMEYLTDHNIQSRPMWHLNHLQRPYRDCQRYHIERAPRLLENTLNIPCSVGITDEQIDIVVETLRNGYEKGH